MASSITSALYQSLYFYGAIGAAVGFAMLNERARGVNAWVRRLDLAIVALAVGGVAAVLGAYTATGFGSDVVLRAALASVAATWVVVNLIILWRNNVIIGRVIDATFVRLAAAAVIATGFVAYMAGGLGEGVVVWAYLAVPAVAGALYRLLLVVIYLRQPSAERIAIATQIEQAFQGDEYVGAAGAFVPAEATARMLNPLRALRRD